MPPSYAEHPPNRASGRPVGRGFRDSSCSLVVSGRGAVGVEVLQDRPGESGEFSRYGHGGDGGPSALLDPSEQLVETMLSFPAMGDDVGGHTLLALSESGTHAGRVSKALGGLDQDMSAVAVAGLGDGASFIPGAGGVLAGNEAHEGHELPRRGEAAQVAEFGPQDHVAVGIDAPETPESPDGLLVSRSEGQLLDLAVEVVPAVDLVLEEDKVFAQHIAILGNEAVSAEKGADPGEMPLGPVVSIPEDQATAPEELEDVVAGLQDLALEGLAAADQVADPLLGLGGDADGDEQPAPMLACERDGIESVVLATVARAGGNQGRGDDLAGLPPSLDGAVKNVAGPAGFLAAVEFTVFSHPSEEAPELGLIVGELLDDARHLGVLGEHGDHHRVIVDIHSDVNLGRSRYGHGSVLLGLRP